MAALQRMLGAAYGFDAADKAAMSAVAGSIEKAFSVGHLQIDILIAAVTFVGATAQASMLKLQPYRG
jgi:hypothetical protein